MTGEEYIFTCPIEIGNVFLAKENLLRAVSLLVVVV
jgi:hypothetical protein